MTMMETAFGRQGPEVRILFPRPPFSALSGPNQPAPDLQTFAEDNAPESGTRVQLPYRAVHFVGFRGEEYHRACRVFGTPDFIHIGWDHRSRREIADGDLILFAKGPHDQPYADRNFDDIRETTPTPERPVNGV